MVVVIQPGIGQFCRLLLFEHAKGHAGLKPQGLHLFDHVQNIRHVLLRRTAPGGAHAKPGSPLFFRGPGLSHNFFDFQQLLFLKTGVVMTALGTVFAILRAGAGLDRQQGAYLNLVRIKILAMHTLGTEQ